MLKWCSYCQQFMGEVPDYEDLSVTHGMCAECHPKVPDLSETDFTRAEFLKRVQDQLFDAGRRSDLKAAEKIIEDTAKANIRPVDILIGIIAPMLYQIGEDWKRGILSVEEEHRYTAFFERTFELIASKVKVGTPANATRSNGPEVLLMNAPGNEHTLAIRILALWLVSRGVRPEVADPHLDLDELVALVGKRQPKLLLISMALAEQWRGVVAIAARIEELPRSVRPKVIVGGYAVKRGLVPPIPGADFMADISALPRPQTSRPD